MTRSALRAGALGCALLASTALTSPAVAQTAPPPRFENVDANGVDLVTGRFVFRLTEGVIGSGDGAVSIERGESNDYGRTDQWSGLLYQRTSGGTTLIYVQFGTQSDTFTISGSTYTSTKANGATLTGGFGGYTYTAPDGTVVNYVTNGPDLGYLVSGPGCSLGDPGTCAIPVSITRPNGMIFTLNWDWVERCHQYDEELNCLNGGAYFRFDGVTSGTGYNFSFNYLTDNPGLPSQGAPPPNWYVRTGATFTNTIVSPPANPTVTYTNITGGQQVTDTGGRAWQIYYTSGNITGIRRPGSSSNDISVSYSNGLVTSVTRDGVTTNYSRAVNGSTATMTVTNALSQQTVVVSNLNNGRITSITDALSRQTQFQYDANARLTQVTQPEGNYVQHTYDSRGNVTQTQAVPKSGSGSPTLTMTASFDASCANPRTCNQPNSTTDARGNTTNYTYDATHGGVLTVTAPADANGVRPQMRYTYQQLNGEYRINQVSACQTQATCTNQADEVQTVIGYDSQGLVNSVTRRNGTQTLTATTTATYDAYGNLLTVDGPLTNVSDITRYRYNAARQVIGVVGPDPDGAGALKHRAIRVAYRSDGLPTKVERGTVNSQSDADWSAFASLEEVQTEYDANDRAYLQRLVSGGTTYAVTQRAFDTLGRTRCVTQRMNSAIFGSLPSDACVLGTEGSYGPDRITRTSYDAAGQVTLVETGVGVTGVEATEVATAYTSNGRVFHVTDGQSNRTTYEYDGHDRLVKTRFPVATQGAATSSTTDYEELTLDANGNVTNLRNRSAQNIAFAYDALNRVTQKTPPAGELQVTYTYDLLNRMTGASQTGNTLSFTFDVLGRNLTQTGPLGTVSYQYDAAGRRTRLTYPGTGLYVDYGYLVTGEISSIVENGSVTLASFFYDNLGRRTSLSRGNGTSTSYSYDPVSRLSQLSQDLLSSGSDLTLTMTYNPASQIATRSGAHGAYAWTGHYGVNRNYTANGLNQYTLSGSIAPTYDARGNLTSAGSTTYGYNSENMLISASGGVTLSYDPMLRLYQTVGSVTTRMVYDGQSLIAEYDGSNNLLRRYVHGPGVDEPIVWYEGTGTSDRRWLHADERGSIVALSNGSGFSITYNAYDEYGIPQSTNIGRFQYTGQQWIGELGMYHYKARVYSPTLGRFLQTDPIGHYDSLNLYSYVLNDPVNLFDPTGLCAADEVAQILPHDRVWTPLPGPDDEATVVAPPFTCVKLLSANGLGWGFGFLYTPINVFGPDWGPVEDLVEGVKDELTELLCAALSFLPEGGRVRIGGDVGAAFGPAATAGAGISMHRDGSVNLDRYFGRGGGVGVPGVSGGFGVGIDSGANPIGTTTSDGFQVSVGRGVLSVTAGSTSGSYLGVSTPGVIAAGTRTTTETTQVSGPMC